MTVRLPILMLAFALLIAGGAGRATPPTADVTATFVSATVGGSRQRALTVTYSVAAERPMRVRLRLFARPTEGQPIAAGLVADRTIAVGAPGRAAFAVPINGAGDIELSLIAEPAAGGASDGDIRYVRVAAAGTASVFTMGEYLVMNGREIAARQPGYGLQPTRGPGDPPLPPGAPAWMNVGGGTAILRRAAAADAGTWPLFRRAAATFWAQASNQLVVEGTITTTVNGVLVPLRNVIVQVWDQDPLSPDDLLGTTMTNENGHYQVTVTNDDGVGGGGVDVYLNITTDQPTVRMGHYVNDSIGIEQAYYVWKSSTSDNLTGPTAGIDFPISANASAAAVWSGASRAQWLAAQQSGHVPVVIPILYPLDFGPPNVTSQGPGYHRNSSRILLPAKFNAPDVVGHEYGHSVMYQAYGTIPGESNTRHKLCTTASNGLAWSEGFATFYGMAASNDNGVFHRVIGDTGTSFENWSCNLQNMSIDEGAVAAGLWDLLDTPTDNNGGNLDQGRNGVCDNNQGNGLVTMDQLLGTLWISSQSDVLAYWTNLLTQLQDVQKPPSVMIMNYNWYTPEIGAPVQVPGQSVEARPFVSRASAGC